MYFTCDPKGNIFSHLRLNHDPSLNLVSDSVIYAKKQQQHSIVLLCLVLWFNQFVFRHLESCM